MGSCLVGIKFPFLDGKKKCPGNGLYNYMNTFEPTYTYTKKKAIMVNSTLYVFSYDLLKM